MAVIFVKWVKYRKNKAANLRFESRGGGIDTNVISLPAPAKGLANPKIG